MKFGQSPVRNPVRKRLRHDADRQNDPWDGRESRESAFEKNLRSKLNPSVSIRDLSPILDDMRRI